MRLDRARRVVELELVDARHAQQRHAAGRPCPCVRSSARVYARDHLVPRRRSRPRAARSPRARDPSADPRRAPRSTSGTPCLIVEPCPRRARRAAGTSPGDPAPASLPSWTSWIRAACRTRSPPRRAARATCADLDLEMARVEHVLERGHRRVVRRLRRSGSRDRPRPRPCGRRAGPRASGRAGTGASRSRRRSSASWISRRRIVGELAATRAVALYSRSSASTAGLLSNSTSRMLAVASRSPWRRRRAPARGRARAASSRSTWRGTSSDFSASALVELRERLPRVR